MMQEKQQCSKQQEASWAQGTKAHDCGEEDPQDRLELPAAAWWLHVNLGLPSLPRTQKGATCPNCQ